MLGKVLGLVLREEFLIWKNVGYWRINGRGGGGWSYRWKWRGIIRWRRREVGRRRGKIRGGRGRRGI